MGRRFGGLCGTACGGGGLKKKGEPYLEEIAPLVMMGGLSPVVGGQQAGSLSRTRAFFFGE